MALKYHRFLEELRTRGFCTERQHFKLEELERVFLEPKVFVFAPMEERTESMMIDTEGPRPALPFKTCFFETTGHDCWTLAAPDGGETLAEICGLFIHENSPGIYTVNVLTNVADGEGNANNEVAVWFPESRHIQAIIIALINELLGKLKNSDIGEANDRTAVKVKTERGKEQHRVGKFFVVAPRKSRGTQIAGLPFTIDWSHRWRVRAHWRHIPGRIGKDREGLPIKDYTWVADYVKGPEDKELIEKVRVIK